MCPLTPIQVYPICPSHSYPGVPYLSLSHQSSCIIFVRSHLSSCIIFVPSYLSSCIIFVPSHLSSCIIFVPSHLSSCIIFVPSHLSSCIIFVPSHLSYPIQLYHHTNSFIPHSYQTVQMYSLAFMIFLASSICD